MVTNLPHKIVHVYLNPACFCELKIYLYKSLGTCVVYQEWWIMKPLRCCVPLFFFFFFFLLRVPTQHMVHHTQPGPSENCFPNPHRRVKSESENLIGIPCQVPLIVAIPQSWNSRCMPLIGSLCLSCMSLSVLLPSLSNPVWRL